MKFDEFNSENIVISLYRPFTKQYLYFNKFWNECQYQQDKLKNNKVIFITGTGGKKGFSTLISNILIDFNSMDAGANCYPLYYIEEDNKNKDKSLFETLDGIENENKKDGVSDYIFNLAKEKYSTKITKEDIF